MKAVIMLLVLTIAILNINRGQEVADDSYEPITIERLTNNLSLVTCTGGEEFNMEPFGTNLVASIGEDEILIVDAGFEATGSKLRDTLASLDRGRVRIIINTHYHQDHAFGNRYFSDEAVIMAHRNAVSRLSGNYYHLTGPPNPNRAMVGFDDSLIIHFNGEEIRIRHAPECHTSGDVYVHFVESKIVAVGDLLFPDQFPYLDVRDGGTVRGYTRQIKRFINDFPDDILFYSAHGRPYNKDDLAEYYRMLTETTRLIKTAAASGQTAEEMIQSNLLAAWDSWSGRFPTTETEDWIRTVYNEVSDQADWRPSICRPLTETLLSGTADEAIAQYRLLKTTGGEEYNFGENELNMLGYQLMARDRLDDALKIFALNIEIYPEAFNVYDSYGEALLAAGDTTQSIANYEKSLKFNADNTNAVQVLEKLHR